MRCWVIEPLPTSFITQVYWCINELTCKHLDVVWPRRARDLFNDCTPLKGLQMICGYKMTLVSRADACGDVGQMDVLAAVLCPCSDTVETDSIGMQSRRRDCNQGSTRLRRRWADIEDARKSWGYIRSRIWCHGPSNSDSTEDEQQLKGRPALVRPIHWDTRSGAVTCDHKIKGWVSKIWTWDVMCSIACSHSARSDQGNSWSSSWTFEHSRWRRKWILVTQSWSTDFSRLFCQGSVRFGITCARNKLGRTTETFELTLSSWRLTRSSTPTIR